jgi:hypothetical protein
VAVYQNPFDDNDVYLKKITTRVTQNVRLHRNVTAKGIRESTYK